MLSIHFFFVRLGNHRDLFIWTIYIYINVMYTSTWIMITILYWLVNLRYWHLHGIQWIDINEHFDCCILLYCLHQYHVAPNSLLNIVLITKHDAFKNTLIIRVSSKCAFSWSNLTKILHCLDFNHLGPNKQCLSLPV